MMKYILSPRSLSKLNEDPICYFWSKIKILVFNFDNKSVNEIDWYVFLILIDSKFFVGGQQLDQFELIPLQWIGAQEDDQNHPGRQEGNRFSHQEGQVPCEY